MVGCQKQGGYAAGCSGVRISDRFKRYLCLFSSTRRLLAKGGEENPTFLKRNKKESKTQQPMQRVSLPRKNFPGQGLRSSNYV